MSGHSCRCIVKLSERIEVIRGIIGFEGLLISDAIDMHALKGSITEKTLTSLQAGCDAVCYALGDISELREIAAICPPLSEPAKERLSRIAQLTTLATPSQQISSQAAEYAEIIGTVELCVEPAGLCGRCTGVAVPLRVVPSATGLLSNICSPP